MAKAATVEKNGLAGHVGGSNGSLAHIRDLIPDKANRRSHNPRNVGMVVDSLHAVGAARSIVIDEQGVVLAGNATLEAAGEAGIERVQVVDADGETLVAVRRTGLSVDQKRQLAMYDNRTAELAEWNAEQLQADLSAGLDLKPWFSEQELTRIVSSDNRRGSKGTLRDVSSVMDPRAAEYAWVRLAVVDFSGGRDSSCALLWAKANLPQERVVALYVDLGADFPGYPLHVWQVAEAIGAELHILRTDRTLTEGLIEKGWPGWKGPWCQDWMHKPLAEWVRANGDVVTTLRMTGTRSKQKKKTSKMAADAPLPSTPEYKALAPIFDWTEASVLKILADAGVPLWEGYARGMKRTACWMCPGQRPAVYDVLRREYPCLFRALQALERQVGPVRFWEPSVLGMTLAETADLGAQMLSTAKVAKRDERDIEVAEQPTGEAPLRVAGGRAREEHDRAGAATQRQGERSASASLDGGRHVDAALDAVSPEPAVASACGRPRRGKAAELLGARPDNLTGPKVLGNARHAAAVSAVRTTVPPARLARETTARKNTPHD